MKEKVNLFQDEKFTQVSQINYKNGKSQFDVFIFFSYFYNLEIKLYFAAPIHLKMEIKWNKIAKINELDGILIWRILWEL